MDFTRQFNPVFSGTDFTARAFLADEHHQQNTGTFMARPQLQDHASVHRSFVPRKLYWIERQQDVWFIRFDGSDYGPYKSEREALLFAVDAAKTLGEQGEATQVLLMDENGEVQPAWTFGQDSYPPQALSS